MIRLTSGNLFDPTRPCSFEPELGETLRTLGRIRRFGGQGTHENWTVLHHTLVGVMSLLESGSLEWARLFLLHDLHESIIGDIPSPLKPVFGAQFQTFEHKLERLFHKRLGREGDEPGNQYVKAVDRACLIAEARLLDLDDGWTDELERSYTADYLGWNGLPSMEDITANVQFLSRFDPEPLALSALQTCRLTLGLDVVLDV